MLNELQHSNFFLQTISFKLSELTNFKLGCRAAAGDSQVMGVLLSMQEVDVHIPQFKVSVSAASHEKLATRREAASHNAGLAHCAASGRET